MKNNKGFSLVELIVVIAIMAILAAVAVAGFSMYIPKAQQASDKQMIADIEDQLIYAGYAGAFEEGEGGYVILSPEGVVAIKGEGFEQVLINAYGENYDDKLKLAYDEWSNNYLFVGLAGDNAQSVYNSTYYAVSDELMGQVKDITGAALSILEVSGSNSKDDMIDLFGSEFLNGVAQQYGYASLDEVSNDEFPNLLVLAVATDITTESNNPTGHEMSPASGLIKNFALYNGYAATAEGKDAGFDEAYDTFVKELNAAKNVDEVAAAYTKLENAAKTDAYETYAEGKGQTDVKAFDAMLAGLAGSTLGSKEQTKDNLGDADFFTTGFGNSLFETYIDSVESFVGIQMDEDEHNEFSELMIQPGVVGIYFSYVNSQIVINNSLPIN